MRFRYMLASLVVPLALLAGCGNPSPPDIGKPNGQHKEDDHAHKPGTHGGFIVAIGADSYHAEAVYEKGGVLRVYVLGKDEGRVQEAEARTLKGFARAEGNTDSVPVELKPEPAEEDKPGTTSVFVATLPADVAGRNPEITVPSITIEGQRFRLFIPRTEASHGKMPAKVADAAERDLYLTPGGKYTARDVEANDRKTASEKFAGFVADHDPEPKAGDKICPVTKTKANPACTWVIDGQSYQFCCPPCIDEFVGKAKKKPDEVRPAGDYLQK